MIVLIVDAEITYFLMGEKVVSFSFLSMETIWKYLLLDVTAIDKKVGLEPKLLSKLSATRNEFQQLHYRKT